MATRRLRDEPRRPRPRPRAAERGAQRRARAGGDGATDPHGPLRASRRGPRAAAEEV